MATKGKQRILVVDDESDAVEFVRAILEDAGYEVASAPNGEQGVQTARAVKPSLVILDVQMPGKDGFSAFADMKKDPELKAIPVVMLTGVRKRLGLRFSSHDMADYLGEEPNAYVEKPVDPRVLQETVRSLLAG
jgi:CheY-like chemotaxis protein